jgi:hypothetical protein
MSKESKWMLAALSALVLTAAVPLAGDAGGSAGPVTPHSLLDLSVDARTPGQPVVALTVDGEVPYESFLVEGPDRLVLDMQGVVNRLERYRFEVGQGGVVQARAAQHQLEPLPITRVVFDLAARSPRAPRTRRCACPRRSRRRRSRPPRPRRPSRPKPSTAP